MTTALVGQRGHSSLLQPQTTSITTAGTQAAQSFVPRSLANDNVTAGYNKGKACQIPRTVALSAEHHDHVHVG